MSKKFAILKDNIVENVVLYDDASAVEEFNLNAGYSVVEETEETGIASAYYTWDGEKFNYAPRPVVEEPAVEPTEE